MLNGDTIRTFSRKIFWIVLKIIFIFLNNIYIYCHLVFWLPMSISRIHFNRYCFVSVGNYCVFKQNVNYLIITFFFFRESAALHVHNYFEYQFMQSFHWLTIGFTRNVMFLRSFTKNVSLLTYILNMKRMRLGLPIFISAVVLIIR